MQSDLDLRGRVVRLEYLTIGWMTIECVGAIVTGVAAGSIVLIGFGLDSLIELGAAFVVLWQFRGTLEGEREHRAHRLIGASMLVLAAYVAADAVYTLARQNEPEASVPGIVIAVLALVIMPLLARGKARLGRAMDNAAVLADAAESLLCAWLSAVVIAGLVLNAALGWWWADPVAALGVAGLAVREGLEAWGEDDHGHHH